MKTLLAIALLSGLGSNDFDVEPNATTIDYTQSPITLTTEGTDFIGGTLGGYFKTIQNFQYVENLGILASVGSLNPNSIFTIELYSGDSLDLVGIYEGNTESLDPAGPAKAIALSLILAGPGDPSDIRGMQFSWLGEGFPIELSMENFVDLNPPTPKITSFSFQPGGFRIQWTGTGSRPVNVQRTTDLKNGPWITIATGITTQEYTDPSTPSNKAFYRVVVP